MAGDVLDEFVAECDPRFAPLVVALDRAILDGAPDLDVAVKYRMLTYGVAGDFRHWVCAIDARRDRVCLRVLRGRLLAAPLGLLRPGSTTMGTLDLKAVGDLDPALVSGLVAEAVDRLDEFRAAYA